MFYILNSAKTTVPASITGNQIVLDGTVNGYNDDAIYGQILNGTTPVVGALVRVSSQHGTDEPVVLGYTYSGCNGDYMLAVNSTSLVTGDTILIEVIGTDLTRTPTACAS